MNTASIAALQSVFYQSIPITRHMGIKVAYYDGRKLRLLAPLALNINDKGTGFGGSLNSLATLAGWGLLFLKLAEIKGDWDILIVQGEIKYTSPAWSDFSASCELPGDPEMDRFFRTLERKGKSRITLNCTLDSGDKQVATAINRFAVLEKQR